MTNIGTYHSPMAPTKGPFAIVNTQKIQLYKQTSTFNSSHVLLAKHRGRSAVKISGALSLRMNEVVLVHGHVINIKDPINPGTLLKQEVARLLVHS